MRIYVYYIINVHLKLYKYDIKWRKTERYDKNLTFDKYDVM